MYLKNNHAKFQHDLTWNDGGCWGFFKEGCPGKNSSKNKKKQQTRVAIWDHAVPDTKTKYCKRAAGSLPISTKLVTSSVQLVWSAATSTHLDDDWSSFVGGDTSTLLHACNYTHHWRAHQELAMLPVTSQKSCTFSYITSIQGWWV